MSRRFTSINDPEVSTALQAGQVGVLRTDTLYGLVACATKQVAVERIFNIKQRSPDKPVLMLIAQPSQMIDIIAIPEVVQRLWPGKNTIIFPAPTTPDWVTRGTKTAAYRVPDDTALRQLLAETGPLVAPSANPEGLQPAMSIKEAFAYFGDSVDFYVDGGEVTDSTPSQLLLLEHADALRRLR